jgi:hypothetical protein
MTPYPEDRFYLVFLTEHVEPGTPYIVAELAGSALAEDVSLACGTIYQHGEIIRSSVLRKALWAWEAKDDDLYRREFAAELLP